MIPKSAYATVVLAVPSTRDSLGALAVTSNVTCLVTVSYTHLLEAAVQRSTLLHVVLPDDGRAINWYVVNTSANRLWAERVGLAGAALAPNASAPDDRPALITLYEHNIGLVTPMLLDELREAEDRYPMHWIEDAIREAVRANARSWRYISKVLERWAAHGRQDAPNRAERPIDVEKYTSGAYGDLFRRGSDTSDL